MAKQFNKKMVTTETDVVSGQTNVFMYYENMLELFREDHPNGTIENNSVELMGGFAIVTSSVYGQDGQALAKGIVGYGDPNETDAVTESIMALAIRRSRANALIAAGYGVPFDVRQEFLAGNEGASEEVAETGVKTPKPRRTRRKKVSEEQGVATEVAKPTETNEDVNTVEATETTESTDLAEEVEVATDVTEAAETVEETQVTEETEVAEEAKATEDVEEPVNVEFAETIDPFEGELVPETATKTLPGGVEIPQWVNLTTLPSAEDALKAEVLAFNNANNPKTFGELVEEAKSDNHSKEVIAWLLKQTLKESMYGRYKADVDNMLAVYFATPELEQLLLKK